MTRITPLRLTTLQLRQIFLTDALTFINSSPKKDGSGGTLVLFPDAGKKLSNTLRNPLGALLFHQAFVLMTHHMRLCLADKIHDNYNNNQ